MKFCISTLSNSFLKNTLILILIVIINLFLSNQNLYGQDEVFNNSQSKLKSEAEILNSIRNDSELIREYRNGKNSLSSAEGLGYIASVLMGLDLALYIGIKRSDTKEIWGPSLLFLISSAITSIVGTIALVKHSNGKAQVKKVRMQVKHSLSMKINLQPTENGIGFVLSF